MNAPTPPDSHLPEGKIFPRNLTARADYAVRGNPSGSRPESGVDNCFPGLEFDQRNLERAFFPGLVVDFHHDSGSRVLAVTGGVAEAQGLTDDDLVVTTDEGEERLYLWAVCGRTTVDQREEDAPVFHADERDGLEMWRCVHDLLPGRVAVVLGRLEGRRSSGARWLPRPGLNGWRMANRNTVLRDDGGVVEAAILVADRARYLDPDGVIDPDVYRPGDLTRTLCAPWQYDFRECGCYYWAASKPDISTSSDGRFRNLNFQRRDRTSVPPPADVATIDGRDLLELDHPELIANWNVLPVVLNGREDDSVPPPALPDLTPMTREEVTRELERLATVEHALCLEYLYAHYSLRAPAVLDPGTDERSPVRQVFAAASEVFSVAVDEMRHLRWVNEILGVLDRPVRLDPPGPDTVIQPQTGRRFELKPLTTEQLDWFIAVEQPSKELNPGGIDGMYVRLHHSILAQSGLFPEADRLAHLIKLIIDEGDDHFYRFTSVKDHLAGLTPEIYLRPLRTNPDDPLDVRLLELTDLNYAVLLGTLRESLSQGDRAGGVQMEQARRAMYNLHETNHLLAARGVAPRFTRPAPPARGALDGQAVLAAARGANRVRRGIMSLADDGLREVMARQQAEVNTLIATLSLR